MEDEEVNDNVVSVFLMHPQNLLIKCLEHGKRIYRITRIDLHGAKTTPPVSML